MKKRRNDTTDIISHLKKVLSKGPLYIAGPCSAESPTQVLETARALSDLTPVHLYRAGIWKPRTKPGMFEGHGEKALPWLREAEEQSGLIPCCEIGTAKQAIVAHSFGIRVVWIGARTSVSPFTMDEIARIIAKIDLVVLLKNPVCPDLPLWLGAEERLKKAGCRMIIPVHRGFSLPQGASPYRNAPLWSLTEKLQRLRPDLPLLCDPSHIAGDVGLIRQICKKAALSGFRGLMAEVHCRPKTALTDSHQQLTPAQFAKLLSHLKWPRPWQESSAGWPGAAFSEETINKQVGGV